MNITIKKLQGGECNLKVVSTTKIAEIKQHIFTKLKVPIEEQKLLFLGRALVDELTVANYPAIKDGTRLNLVVKKPERLFEVSMKYFKKTGMSETEARNAANRLLKIVAEKFKKLSLDDIERLSADCMWGESSGNRPPVEQEPDGDCDDAFGL